MARFLQVWPAVLFVLFVVSGVVGLMLLGGCAAQRGLINLNVVLAPKPVDLALASTTSVVGLPKSEEAYVVKRGDCLWKIAGLKSVYDDSYQWPELWKYNQDSIADPDVIEPGLILRVTHEFDPKLARQAASIWPAQRGK